MNKFLFGLIFIALAIGLVHGASGFGEYASPHGELIFNQTNTTHFWTLVSTFNTPLSFYITIPSLNGITISTVNMSGQSILNGSIYTMPADSAYPIKISISGISQLQQSANITAYLTATANSGTNSLGANIQLATSKKIIIEPSNSIPTTTIPQGSAGQSTGGIQPSSGVSANIISIVQTSNGYDVYNVSQYSSFSLTLCGTRFLTLDNYITPNSTGVTINNASYDLLLAQTQSLANGCSVELLNVSYVPRLHTVELGFSSNSITATTTTTSTIPQTTTTLPTTILPTSTVKPANTIPTTTIQPTGSNNNTTIIIVIIITIILVIILAWALTKK